MYFGNLNFFGGASKVNTATSKRLKQLELANEDAMFVFLSDVWLDQVKVRVTDEVWKGCGESDEWFRNGG